MEIELYTDGACSNNGKPNAKGAWAAVLKYGDYIKEFSGVLNDKHTHTNQRAEVEAVINGLLQIKPDKRHLPITITTDSQYVIMTMTGKWHRKKNLDLWLSLDTLVKHFPNLKWQWVRGHADNEFNNRCDKLAVDAIKKGA